MACNCMGPQRGQPLCPCQMRAAAAYLNANDNDFGINAVRLVSSRYKPISDEALDKAVEAIRMSDQ